MIVRQSSQKNIGMLDQIDKLDKLEEIEEEKRDVSAASKKIRPKTSRHSSVID